MVENVVATVERGDGISPATENALTSVVGILNGINLDGEHDASVATVEECWTKYTDCAEESQFQGLKQQAGSNSQCGVSGYSCPTWGSETDPLFVAGTWSRALDVDPSYYVDLSDYADLDDKRQDHRACRYASNKQCNIENDLCIEYWTYLNSTEAKFPRCAIKSGDWTDGMYDNRVVYNFVWPTIGNSGACEDDVNSVKDGCLKQTGSLDANWWTKDRPDMEACLTAVKSWHAAIWPKYVACRDGVEGGGLAPAPALLQEQVTSSSDKCTTQQAECDGKQDVFEQAHCTWTKRRLEACYKHQHCFDSHMTTCATNCGVAIADAAVRKNEYITIEKIKCFIQVILGNQTEHTDSGDELSDKTGRLAACKNYRPPDIASKYNMNCVDETNNIFRYPSDSSKLGDQRCHYKDWASFSFDSSWGFNCQVDSRPCTSEFLAAEYDWASATGEGWEVTPLADCYSCTGPTFTSDLSNLHVLTNEDENTCNTGSTAGSTDSSSSNLKEQA